MSSSKFGKSVGVVALGLGLLGVGLVGAGCGGGGGGNKADAAVDAGFVIWLDAAVDGAPVDGPPEVDARVDAASIPLDGGMNLVGSCVAPLDLNTLGTLTGTATSISGNNSGAPAAAPEDIEGPSCAINLDGNHASYAVEFSYTMRTTAHLRADTAVTGTAPEFDSIVWIVDGCGNTANELGCNDEVSRTEGRARAFTAATIAAGTTVRIAVAGFTPTSATRTNRAPFTLVVDELPDNAAGAACSSLSPFCVADHHCILSPPGGTTGTCLPDGTLNGACRIAGTPCDGTMLCSVPTPVAGARGVCQEPLAVGTACTATAYVCVSGAHCTADPGSTTATTCRMDGTEYGQCLLTMPYCATALRCTRDTPSVNRPGLCTTPLAHGAVCQFQTTSCVAGDHCVRDASGTASHCVTDGTAGGRCLPGNACNAGLTCGSNNTCQ